MSTVCSGCYISVINWACSMAVLRVVHLPNMLDPSTSVLSCGLAVFGAVDMKAIPVASVVVSANAHPRTTIDMRRRERQKPGAEGGVSHLTGRAWLVAPTCRRGISTSAGIPIDISTVP